MKTNLRICILFVFAAICICRQVPYEILHYRIDQRELREQTVSSVLAIDRCGWNQTFLGKKKFDLAFHRQLEQHFPDWNPRMDYQKKQEEFYKAAMRKKREAIRIRLPENFNRTREEQDAINYFHGTGIYAQYQDPETKPNIFDTRQSFLLKNGASLRKNARSNITSKLLK